LKGYWFLLGRGILGFMVTTYDFTSIVGALEVDDEEEMDGGG
jgi:hypothetical protein